MPTLALIALSAQLLSASADDLLVKVGDEAPPFSMRDLGGKIFTLGSHVGTETTEKHSAVVLAFFATWCKPCMKEIPVMKAIHARWKARGVEIVYVGLAQGAKELGPFAKEQALPWRVVPDSFGLLARRYGASELPHLFVINPKGTVAFQQRGIAENLEAILDSQLVRVTGTKAPGMQASEGSPSSVDRPRFSTTYRFGRTPSGEGSAARWQPLATFLGESVSASIEVATEPSYESFSAALRAGKYDLVNAGPLVCQEVKDLYEPIARLERQGTPTYFGVIFTSRTSAVRSLGDLKGKTLGLVDEKSTSGGLYPQLALLDAGLVPGRDVTIKWLGKHPDVAEAVKSGAVDAGGCYEDCRDAVWPTTRDKAVGTRILGYTREIPAEMILVRRSLNAKTKQALAKAMLDLNKQPDLLTQISQHETTVTAVLPASERDLDAINEAVNRLAAARKP